MQWVPGLCKGFHIVRILFISVYSTRCFSEGGLLTRDNLKQQDCILALVYIAPINIRLHDLEIFHVTGSLWRGIPIWNTFEISQYCDKPSKHSRRLCPFCPLVCDGPITMLLSYHPLSLSVCGIASLNRIPQHWGRRDFRNLGPLFFTWFNLGFARLSNYVDYFGVIGVITHSCCDSTAIWLDRHWRQSMHEWWYSIWNYRYDYLSMP